MKKLLLGLMLVAVPVVGCGPGVVEEPTADNPETITTESGQNVTMVAEPGPQSFAEEPVASMSVPADDVSAMGPNCWVTLQYCHLPGAPPYTAYCTDNGKCTRAQLENNCIALIRKNC
jgi:hypothetical protein